MKRTLALLMVLFFAQVSQAKTICSISTGANMNFDRVLLSQEIKAPTIFVVGQTSAVEVDLAKVDTISKWSKLDGKSLVMVGPQEGGVFGLSVIHVELSATDNILPNDAMALGQLGTGRYLSLLVPSRSLSVNCMDLN